MASTGPASTRFRSSAVSSVPNRPGRRRRTRPIRSMSATKFTASVTVANSSGRIVRNRKIGWSASLRTDVAEQPERVVVGPLDVVDEQGERPDVATASTTATPARSNARRSFASGDRLSKPGSSRPEMASTTRRTAASAGVPAAMSRIAADANRLRARRNGPRISSSAVIATQVNPFAVASSTRREEQARLADAGLALEGHRGETAGRLVDLLRDRLELGASADDPARCAAQLDGERALRPDDRVEGIAVHHPKWRGDARGTQPRPACRDYDRAPSESVSTGVA